MRSYVFIAMVLFFQRQFSKNEVKADSTTELDMCRHLVVISKTNLQCSRKWDCRVICATSQTHYNLLIYR